MKEHKLLTKTPSDWLLKTDINEYAKRQAQSCDYLEVLFEKISDKRVVDLFDYLVGVHRRQYSDISKVIFVPSDANRKSYYFDKMYEAFGLSTDDLQIKKDLDLLTVLSIQFVSYLRGRDRYRLLKDYTNVDNTSFIPIWKKFYQDATRNADTVYDFLVKHFDTETVNKKIEEVIKKEDNMIHLIWENKNVKTN